MQVMPEPECNGCDEKCWAYPATNQPCWGEMHVSEDYIDGEWRWTHFCDGHGNPEERRPYNNEGVDDANRD